MSEDIKTSKGKLYLVSTPIGNKDDFTVRAMNSLKRCDFVICEELKIGAKVLRQLNLSKDLVPLNEHNEVDATDEILARIINGEKACLISDDGTPLIADPGNHFMKEALRRNVEIEVVPGVTSIITALVRSGLPTDQFVFAGFVSRKTEDKFQDVRELSREKRTVVLLETPYRLASTLEVLCKIMPNRKAYIGMNLTHAYETHHYGTFEELFQKLSNLEIKAEFVVCFEGSDFGSYHKKNDFSDEKGFNRSDFKKSPRMDESGSYRSGGSGVSYKRDRNSGSRDNRGSYRRDRNKDSFRSEGASKKKDFDKPRSDNFKEGDFDNSGFFTKEYNKSSERSGERKFGDKPNYSKGDRKDSKFSSKSGGKFGGSKSGGSKFGGKKFVKRTRNSKGS